MVTASPKARGRSIHVDGLAHGAPIPVGARVGPLVCSSSIYGIDPATGDVPATAEAEIEALFANVRRFLDGAGVGTGSVVRMTVSLADGGLRGTFDEAWVTMFPDGDDRPARHVVIEEVVRGRRARVELLAFDEG